MNHNKNNAIKTMTKAYFAFTLMFGFYLMAHGHISHGAGFAGGVIVVLGFLFAFIVLGSDTVSAIINLNNAKLVMLFSVAMFLLITVLGYFYGKGFMYSFIEFGKPFSIFSAGISAVYNLTLCFGTIGCLLYIYLIFFNVNDKG
jgi:multisubunit Na+/H+ antiporter MnhB subunit